MRRWVLRQLSDHVSVASGQDGVRVLLSMRVALTRGPRPPQRSGFAQCSGSEATASVTLGCTWISWSMPTRSSTRQHRRGDDGKPHRGLGRGGPPRGPHQRGDAG